MKVAYPKKNYLMIPPMFLLQIFGPGTMTAREFPNSPGEGILLGIP